MKFVNVPWYFLWKFKRATSVACAHPFLFQFYVVIFFSGDLCVLHGRWNCPLQDLSLAYQLVNE